MMSIVCKKTGVKIEINKSDGGKGCINLIRVFNSDGDLKSITNIYENGNEVESRNL